MGKLTLSYRCVNKTGEWGGDIQGYDFQNFAGMLSQPVALFTFSFCSLVKTSSGLTGRKANVLIFSFPFLMATTLGWYTCVVSIILVWANVGCNIHKMFIENIAYLCCFGYDFVLFS